MNWIGLYMLTRREVERTLRVASQTLLTPLISATLYIYVFGYVVGPRIALIAGVPYISFVLPGILMMNVIMAAFSGGSFGLYFHRFLRTIEEVLVAPLSYAEIVSAFVISSVIRTFLIGLGIFAIAVLFGAAGIAHVWLFCLYIIAVSIIFALLGILVGLWANNFEQLGVLTTFVITPFTFLGGTFFSVTMIPERWRIFLYFNPFFYFIDGIRYAMIGVRESSALYGALMMVGLIVVLFALVWKLFKTGWHIRS